MISDVYVRFKNTSEKKLCGVCPDKEGDLKLRHLNKNEVMLACHEGFQFIGFVMAGRLYTEQELSLEENSTEDDFLPPIENKEDVIKPSMVDSPPDNEEDDSVDMKHLRSLKVQDLREAVEAMGIPSDGTKKEILRRVKESTSI